MYVCVCVFVCMCMYMYINIYVIYLSIWLLAVGLYTILAIPIQIWYVEWQHRGLGGNAIYWSLSIAKQKGGHKGGV